MRHDPTLPIKLDSTSNGEYAPLAGIFGLNAASIHGVDPTQARCRAEGDPIDRLRAAYRQDPRPIFVTYGPRDVVEWRRFRAIHGVGPG